jgi:amphiphysin
VFSEVADLTLLQDFVIDRRVVQPANDMVSLHKLVRKTIVKRDHKKIDYDRHRESLKKLKEKATRDAADERKINQVRCGGGKHR